jgi:FixJ family two-component response regulator
MGFSDSHIARPAIGLASSPEDGLAALVFVVDDDLSFLRSLSRLLKAAGFNVATCRSAAEFLARLGPDTRGCLITDLRMPGMDGLALLEAMHKADNPLPVIFLSGHGDVPTTVRAMRGGAEDFLTKSAPKEELLAAVTCALARDELDAAERLRLKTLCERLARLTEREKEVLGRVVQGKLNKQIAAELGIHERTVKLHRTSITSKLQVQSVAELTRLVDETGFLDG